MAPSWMSRTSGTGSHLRSILHRPFPIAQVGHPGEGSSRIARLGHPADLIMDGQYDDDDAFGVALSLNRVILNLWGGEEALGP